MLIVKILQVIVFVWLTAILILQRRRAEKSYGSTPIWITCIIILNGISEIVRTWSSDSYHFDHKNDMYKVNAACILVSHSTTFLALWLFGGMVFETALDIEQMLIQDQGQNKDQSLRNKTNFVRKYRKILNFFVSLLILLS